MIKIIVGSHDLNHPQSNALDENAVQQAKNLFCMCKKDSYYLRNVPRDQIRFLVSSDSSLGEQGALFLWQSSSSPRKVASVFPHV